MFLVPFEPFNRAFFNLLQVFPVSNGGAPISEFPFARTGLLGFIGPAGLVFVAGKMDGLMAVGGRRHNADDIVATALAVEPMKFVYRGRYGDAGSWGRGKPAEPERHVWLLRVSG